MKKLFFVLLMAVALYSCNSKSAFDYNQDFVKKERSLIPGIDSTESKVAAFLGAGQFDSMRIVSERMEGRINNVIIEIKQKPAPDTKSGPHFKAEVVRYFEFMKSIYTLYREFAAANGADRPAVRLRLRSAIANRGNVIANIKKAQTEFASANGFRIEK